MIYRLSQAEKRSWGQGPWIDEPEDMEWVDRRTDFPCLIARAHTTGAFCGYAGVPPGHVLYGMEYSSGLIPSFINLINGKEEPFTLDAHGGINYSGDIPGAAYNDYWYFGFDCAHAGDYSPQLESHVRGLELEYPEFADMRAKTQKALDGLVLPEHSFLEAYLRPLYVTMENCIADCQQLAAQLNTTALFNDVCH